MPSETHSLAGALRFTAMVALALILAACKWVAYTPLMPVAAFDDPAPLAVGDYVEVGRSGTTQTISAVTGNTKVLHVAVHDTSGEYPDGVYNTGYDQIDGAYYLVEVFVPGSREWLFLVLRTRLDGYDYWLPTCASTVDAEIALSAGAALGRSSNDRNSSDCVFSSYPSVLQAARGIVSSIRAGTYGGQMVSFNRR